MAKAGGSTVSVDANGDGDYVDANDINAQALSEGQNIYALNILEGATVSATNPVQVHQIVSDAGDSFELRWFALVPRPNWDDSYFAPVGTQPDGSNGNRGCTEVWIYNPAIGTTNNVRDQFDSRAYNLNNGSVNWSIDWCEEGDGAGCGSATAGDIQVTDTTGSDELRFDGADTNDAIYRQADLTGATSATLSFLWAESSSGGDDDIVIEARNGTSGGWTNLATYDGNTSNGTKSIILPSGVIGSQTQIRFRALNQHEDSDEFDFDDVDITFSTGGITVNIDTPTAGDPNATLVIPAEHCIRNGPAPPPTSTTRVSASTPPGKNNSCPSR